MLAIEPIDTRNRAHVERFVRLPYRLYANHPCWVPAPLGDARLMLKRDKHPYYTRSDADFFIVSRDGRDVGRIAALENRAYNRYHNTRQAQFYCFDCENDPEAAGRLFETVFAWARARGLNRVVGPKGFGPLDGYGILVEGFEHRQLMTMMNYNYPYYPALVEGAGFRKEVDFVSCYIDARQFRLPERVHSIARRAAERSGLRVLRFTSKREVVQWVPRIAEAYNKAFVNNWEYYPLAWPEIKLVLDNVLLLADPRLIKIIAHGDDAVGFLFAFPDVSAALQRAKGRLFPFAILDLLIEMRRTKWVAFNGAGILPEYHGRGGNALLYSEMERTLREFHFQHGDLTQVAETATQMRADLENLGGRPYKNHRVYARDV